MDNIQRVKSFMGFPSEIPWQALETPLGKGSRAYNAHPYHTKLSLDICQILIRHFTERDELVLDPFAGSGMVGIACMFEKRDAILLDISPYAVHIATGLTTYINPGTFLEAAQEAVRKTLEHASSLLLTHSRESGKPVPIDYVVWSERVSCMKCRQEFVLWDVAIEPDGRISEAFACPFCGTKLNKKELARKGSVPVEVVYREPGNGRQSRVRPTEEDMNLCLRPSVNESSVSPWQPSNPMMNIEPGHRWGEQWRKGYHYNITHVKDFFSSRNWLVLGYLWVAIEETEDAEIRKLLRLAFTGTLVNTSKMVRYIPSRGGRSNTPGTLYLPMVWLEQNPIVVFERRARRIEAHLKSLANSHSSKVVVQVGSASQLDFLGSERVDFVLTDPPFGENIQYAELNFVAEAWLKSFTNRILEAVVNPHRGQYQTHYLALMHKSLIEAFRVLKKGRYAAIFFNNTDTKLWKGLRELIMQTGFKIVKAIPACKGHQSWNQLRYRETVTAWDPIIFLWKPFHELPPNKGSTREKNACDVHAEARGFLRGLIELEARRKDDHLSLQHFYSQYVSAWFEGRIPGEILDMSTFAMEAKKILAESKRGSIPAKKYDSAVESSKAFVEAVKSVSGKRDEDIDGLSLSNIYEKWIENVHGGSLARRRRAEGSKRRRGGAFYTPPYVVALLVDKLLNAWLLPRAEMLRSSLSMQKTEDVVRMLEEIARITILDPAVGTGLFLLGARQYLREITPTILQGVLTADFKANHILDETGILSPDATLTGSRWDRWIVGNALWGVDVDIGALHVATEVISDGLNDCTKPNLLQANSISLALARAQKLSTKLDQDIISWYNWPKALGKTKSFWDIVIGNPPWGTVLPREGNIDYSFCHDESALAFLILAEKLLEKDGQFGFVLPSSWLQASSWRIWRQRYVRKLGLRTLLVLPETTFPDATFTAPPIISIFSPSNTSAPFDFEYVGLPSSSPVAPSKGSLLDDWKGELAKIKTNKLYRLSYSQWSKIPGYRIPVAGEWWIDRFFHIFSDEKLEFYADLIPLRNITAKVVRGVKTGANEEFIAEYNPNVHPDVYSYSHITGKSGIVDNGATWVWLAKGGSATNNGRPVHFVQPRVHVIRWDKKSVSIYRSRAGLRNAEFYGRLGIGFPSTGRHSPLFRRVEDMVFDADYPVIIPQSAKDVSYLLAVLNSPCILFAAKHLLNHSVHFKTGDLLDLPIPNVSGALRDRLSSVSDGIIQAIELNDTKEEMKRFHEIHEIMCDILGIPAKERAECESWYVSRFPGMKSAFENSDVLVAQHNHLEVSGAFGS